VSEQKRPRTAVARPATVPDRIVANGSNESRAERVLAAARVVDENEALLAAARAELKDAVEALTA
jgi:hypothetical protein